MISINNLFLSETSVFDRFRTSINYIFGRRRPIQPLPPQAALQRKVQDSNAIFRRTTPGPVKTKLGYKSEYRVTPTPQNFHPPAPQITVPQPPREVIPANINIKKPSTVTAGISA